MTMADKLVPIFDEVSETDKLLEHPQSHKVRLLNPHKLSDTSSFPEIRDVELREVLPIPNRPAPDFRPTGMINFPTASR